VKSLAGQWIASKLQVPSEQWKITRKSVADLLPYLALNLVPVTIGYVALNVLCSAVTLLVFKNAMK